MFTRIIRLSVYLTLALALAACNLPRPATAEPFPTDQSTARPDLAATLTALAPTAAAALPTANPTVTNTAQPTQAAPTAQPTATNTTAPQQSGGIPVVQITPIATLGSAPVIVTPVKPATSVPQTGATRIAFDRFATSKNIDGNLALGETRSFVAQVGGGQILMTSVYSPNNDVFLRIIAANGQILLDSGMGIGQTSWQGRIFVTQDITIQVIARNSATNFTLSLTIPEIIQFDPGAVSATRAYPIAARDVHTFTLRALAGQTMAVWVTSSNGVVLLGIYGYEDGQPYKRSSVGDPQYTFELPLTQDYVIQVVSASDTPADFNLQVVVN